MPLAGLDAALGDSTRILLDSSAMIAYHRRAASTHVLARHLFDRIEDESDRLLGSYSVISAAELLVRPLRAGGSALMFMHSFLTTHPNLTALPMDLSVAMQAATLRATTGIRLPDAIVVASGLLAGCEAIVSNDEQWRRRMAPLFRDFRWISLGEFI